MTRSYNAKCPQCKEIVAPKFKAIRYLGVKGGVKKAYQATCPKCGHEAEVWGATMTLATDGFEFENELKVSE